MNFHISALTSVSNGGSAGDFPLLESVQSRCKGNKE